MNRLKLLIPLGAGLIGFVALMFVSGYSDQYESISSVGGGEVGMVFGQTLKGKPQASPSGGNFLSLSDTPDTFADQGSKCVAVNDGGTALEFVACAGGITSLGGLSDVGTAGTTAGFVLRADGDSYEGARLSVDDLSDGTTYKLLTATKDGYINQSVVSGATPTFTGTNITGIPLNNLTNPTANTAIAMTTRQLKLSFTNPITADGGLEVEGSGAFEGDLIHVHQHTGNVTAADLLHLEAEDADVVPLRVVGAGAYSIISGQIQANLTGNVTGNSTTATGLAADGSNCNAGEYPLGIDVSGAVQSCTDATTEINSLILSHAGNASAHHAPITVSGTPDYITLSGQDLVRGTVDISDDTNLAAGRSLTMSGDSVEGDAELYTDTKCAYWTSPADTDDFKSIWMSSGFASTITKVWCESDQTVNLDLQIDDGSPADVMGTDLACASTPVSDNTSLTGSMADGDRLDVAVTSVSGTPTWASVCWTYTKND